MARDTRLEEFVSDVNNGEEGEISFVETTKKEVQYDVDKLIGWPGFNVEPNEDYKDDYHSKNFRCSKAWHSR